MCSPKDYDRACKRLDICERCWPYTKQLDGKRQYMNLAVMFAATLPDVNEDRLVSQMSKHWGRMKPIVSIDNALDELSAIYNYMNRASKVFLKEAYARFVEENCKRNVINERKKRNQKYREDPQARLKY